jgi:hypothetical protein
MPFAPQDDGFPEIVKRRFWRLKGIIPIRHVLHEHAFGFVTLKGKRIERVRESIVQPGQRPNLFLRNRS